MSPPPASPDGPTWSDEPDEPVEPVHVSMPRVVGIGMIGWGVVLVVLLLVPSLRTGDRAWWPWCCVAGIALGAAGLVYLARRRGNAAAA